MEENVSGCFFLNTVYKQRRILAIRRHKGLLTARNAIKISK